MKPPVAPRGKRDRSPAKRREGVASGRKDDSSLSSSGSDSRRISSHPVDGTPTVPHDASVSLSDDALQRRARVVGASRVPVLSTGMAERLAEREAAALHVRRRRIAWGFGFFVVLAGAIWVVFFSPVFAVDVAEVRVNGTSQYVSEDQIRSVLEPYEGVPLARLDMARIGEQISDVPNVRDFVHTRRWPHGITVSVTERVPVAAVPRDDSFELLDREAVTVDTVPQAPSDLPLIDLPREGDDQRVLTNALDILDALPSGLLGDIEKLTASTQDDVVLRLRDGLKVQWGSSQDSAVKVSVLEVLRPKALDMKKKTIDLSAPNFPIIK